MLVFGNTIEIRDFVTATSVLVAVSGLLIASMRDRRLKRKEYAQRIRDAAASTAVAIERWRELSARIYEDIQPLITDTDVMLVKTQDIVSTRDFFWRGLVEARSVASSRILSEKLHTAYVGLFGYASDIQAHYGAAHAA